MKLIPASAFLLSFAYAGDEMSNVVAVATNLGSLEYDFNCMDIKSYYIVDFDINAELVWDVPPTTAPPTTVAPTTEEPTTEEPDSEDSTGAPARKLVEYEYDNYRIRHSTTKTMNCRMKVYGGTAWHDRNGNDYRCLGRCGGGCSSSSTWRDMSSWSIDCLSHDVCSYFFADSTGSSVDICKDALITAADDFLTPGCWESYSEKKWSKSRDKHSPQYNLLCDGHIVQPGGAIEFY